MQLKINMEITSLNHLQSATPNSAHSDKSMISDDNSDHAKLQADVCNHRQPFYTTRAYSER